MKKRNINLNKVFKKSEKKKLLSEDALDLITVYMHLNGYKVKSEVFEIDLLNDDSLESREVLDFLKKEGIL